MKYILYCRKSTDSEDKQVLSLDSQEKELLDIVGLSWQDYGSIGEDVEKEIEKAQIFLHV